VVVPDHDGNGIARLEEELGAMARTVTDEDRNLRQPPPDIWDGIRRTVLDERVVPFPIDRLRPLESTKAQEPPSDTAPEPDRPRLEVTPRHMILAIAAAMTVMLASAAWLSQTSPTDEIATVASAVITNTGLPVAFDQQGDATVVAEGDQLYLDLVLPTMPDLEDENGYYELWLIDNEVNDMVSLGAVQGSTRIALPDGVDLEVLPIVDVSVESVDGDATHSGQSVLRGVLEL